MKWKDLTDREIMQLFVSCSFSEGGEGTELWLEGWKRSGMSSLMEYMIKEWRIEEMSRQEMLNQIEETEEDEIAYPFLEFLGLSEIDPNNFLK